MFIILDQAIMFNTQPSPWLRTTHSSPQMRANLSSPTQSTVCPVMSFSGDQEAYSADIYITRGATQAFFKGLRTFPFKVIAAPN